MDAVQPERIERGPAYESRLDIGQSFASRECRLQSQEERTIRNHDAARCARRQQQRVACRVPIGSPEGMPLNEFVYTIPATSTRAFAVVSKNPTVIQTAMTPSFRWLSRVSTPPMLRHADRAVNESRPHGWCHSIRTGPRALAMRHVRMGPRTESAVVNSCRRRLYGCSDHLGLVLCPSVII